MLLDINDYAWKYFSDYGYVLKGTVITIDGYFSSFSCYVPWKY